MSNFKYLDEGFNLDLYKTHESGIEESSYFECMRSGGRPNVVAKAIFQNGIFLEWVDLDYSPVADPNNSVYVVAIKDIATC
jgi:hypothetical protein